MVAAFIALAVAYVVTSATLGRIIDRDRREHARERQLLVNQLMHLADRPWTPSPADELELEKTRERLADARDARVHWISPEQLPVE